MKTPVGKEFKKHLDRVGRRPDISEYWQLWNPVPPKADKKTNQLFSSNLKAPRLHTIGEDHFLIYQTNGEEQAIKSCAPPDSTPITAAQYFWQLDNKFDNERGITPPPAPRPLKPRLKG
jgi:hypothetical protein